LCVVDKTGWVLVLAKFTRTQSEQRIFCLTKDSVPLHSYLAQIGLELVR